MHALSDIEKANKQMAILQPLIAHHLRSPLNNPCTSSYFVVSRVRPGNPSGMLKSAFIKFTRLGIFWFSTWPRLCPTHQSKATDICNASITDRYS